MYDEFNSYEVIYSIEDVRRDLNRVVDYWMNQEWHENAVKVALEGERKLSPEIVKECKAFFIPEDVTLYTLPDWMKNESLGMVLYGKYIIQSGRIVYPVFDVKGDVMGFCGWDKYVNPKYLDSKNYGYKAKETTLYGMEKLEEYYNSKEPVFVVEGIVCCLYLRSKGFQALALLGSHMTQYVTQILKRFGKRLVLIPDCDGAGDSLVRQAKSIFKGITIVQMKYGKDIDGCRKFGDGIYEQQLLKELKSLYIPFSPTQICLRR